MNAKSSKKQSRTNWRKVGAQVDPDIDTSDIPELDAEFFRSAELRMPAGKTSITVRLDSDVLEWFRNHSRTSESSRTVILVFPAGIRNSADLKNSASSSGISDVSISGSTCAPTLRQFVLDCFFEDFAFMT